jgi:hypothetical protein
MDLDMETMEKFLSLRARDFLSYADTPAHRRMEQDPSLGSGIKKKIVGLSQVRNVGATILETYLRAYSLVVDALVVLDDFSTDDTLIHLHKLKSMLPIETIIERKNWTSWDEVELKSILLEEGRRINGTHFVFLDGIEIIYYFQVSMIIPICPIY